MGGREGGKERPTRAELMRKMATRNKARVKLKSDGEGAIHSSFPYRHHVDGKEKKMENLIISESIAVNRIPASLVKDTQTEMRKLLRKFFEMGEAGSSTGKMQMGPLLPKLQTDANVPPSGIF